MKVDEFFYTNLNKKRLVKEEGVVELKDIKKTRRFSIKMKPYKDE